MVATRISGAVIEGSQPQLQWAAELNPTIVSVTVGADDIGLSDPTALFGRADTGEVDLGVTELEERLDRFGVGLRRVLDTLITKTDAHVALTTYYDPTADDPVGIDGCSGTCFAAAMGDVIEALNDRLRVVAADQPASRVTLVELDDAFAGARAPNGFGPDLVRELDLGPFGGVVDRFTGGTSAYCADGDGPEETLVSRLDCRHPNDGGHAVVAERVARALFEI